MSYYGYNSPTGGNAISGNIIPKGYNYGQINQFTPEQMNLFKSLFGQLGPESFLGKLASGDQGFYDQMEAPALRQFNELTGNLGSRFAGIGQGSTRSSGFKNALTAEASSLAEKLQAQRQGLQSQAVKDLFGLSKSLLSERPYEKFLQEKPEKQNSFLQQLLLGAIGGGGGGGGELGSLLSLLGGLI